MILLKSFLIFLIILYFFPPAFGDDKDFQKANLKSLQCNFSVEFVYPNYSCFAKSYSRTVSTMNIDLTLKKPLAKVFEVSKRFNKEPS